MRAIFLCLLAALPAGAVQWTAHWISVPGSPRTDYGVYHFRKTLSLASKPSKFIVHVSADNRYQLFVNGRRVAWGPARGDTYHWRYETVDISPELRAGPNAISAVVWNFGADSPMAQISVQTGFLLQGDTAAERAADTNRSWKCVRNLAYSAIPVRMGRDVAGYYVAGPGERVDAKSYPWNWESPGFDDSGWKEPVQLGVAAPRGARDAHSPWMLVPRNIPAMEETPEPALVSRTAQKLPLVVAPNSEATLILDQGYYTTGYPELTVSGGKGGEVSLRYAESLFEKGKWIKGNRNEVDGKEFRGYRDAFVPDGGSRRTWRPLWWRTWRYIELSVKAAGEPITVDSLTTTFTGYPFVRRAKLSTMDRAANDELQRMLDVSWKTLRVDAHETFMDCAYYEQLQYIGDTRLEALTTFTLSGDARLVKNAISTLNDTRTPDGLTHARGPGRLPQYIPPFSLYWIGMVHDYWMYQDDPTFVREMLPGTRAILAWFAEHQRQDGLLGPLPWWNYMDWVEGWRAGVPPNGDAGGSAMIDLLYLMALNWAAGLERALGSEAIAAGHAASAERMASSIRTQYWDVNRRLFADTPARREFSQHTNALAILAGLLRGDEARRVAAALVEDRSLTESTLYFRYYIHSALREAGLGDRFLDQLGTWREALRIGLTTWPEKPEPSRSDAHAWSSHIAHDMFLTMLGVRPAAPGFRKVIIEPSLGKLTQLAGTMPHPKGEIEVVLDKTGGSATVTLPEGVEGEIVWNGARRPLRSGRNDVR